MTTPTVFMKIQLGTDSIKLFQVDQGLKILELLSQGVAVSPRYGSTALSYPISFVTDKELEQQQIDLLLGVGS